MSVRRQPKKQRGGSAALDGAVVLATMKIERLAQRVRALAVLAHANNEAADALAAAVGRWWSNRTADNVIRMEAALRAYRERR